MTGYVVDASVLGPLLILDEAHNLHPRLYEILRNGDAVVPGHWRLEVASLGRNAVRRKRLEQADLAETLALFATFPVVEDEETSGRAWDRTLTLAAAHGLTIYDAAYLELALRRRLPLVSTDSDLRSAAVAEAVALADA